MDSFPGGYRCQQVIGSSKYLLTFSGHCQTAGGEFGSIVDTVVDW